MNKFIIVKIDINYCNYLRKFDNKVAYNSGKKELRPFIGILFKVGKIDYFAPLSSPKNKHKVMKDKVDFIKIDNGNLGAINFNNMIPVAKDNYQIIDITKLKNKKYINLLNAQMRYLNRNYENICQIAYNLYKAYITKTISKKVKKRCCNFPLLEEKGLQYQKEELIANK